MIGGDAFKIRNFITLIWWLGFVAIIVLCFCLFRCDAPELTIMWISSNSDHRPGQKCWITSIWLDRWHHSDMLMTCKGRNRSSPGPESRAFQCARGRGRGDTCGRRVTPRFPSDSDRRRRHVWPPSDAPFPV